MSPHPLQEGGIRGYEGTSGGRTCHQLIAVHNITMLLGNGPNGIHIPERVTVEYYE